MTNWYRDTQLILEEDCECQHNKEIKEELDLSHDDVIDELYVALKAAKDELDFAKKMHPDIKTTSEFEKVYNSAIEKYLSYAESK